MWTTDLGCLRNLEDEATFSELVHRQEQRRLCGEAQKC